MEQRRERWLCLSSHSAWDLVKQRAKYKPGIIVNVINEMLSHKKWRDQDIPFCPLPSLLAIFSLPLLIMPFSPVQQTATGFGRFPSLPSWSGHHSWRQQALSLVTGWMKTLSSIHDYMITFFINNIYSLEKILDFAKILTCLQLHLLLYESSCSEGSQCLL